MTSPLEPLRFERHFVAKIWGGRALEERPGIALPPDVAVGETWEIVDRANENSVVAEGTHRGRTLRELMEELGAEILGIAPAARDGRFPLLVKYIDASHDLSVQVHPDEASAARIGGGAEAKTEGWYVVGAAEGGALYCGLRPDVQAEEFARIAAGPGVVDVLARWAVRSGDCLLVPGGTVHAIGAGVTILEVQQNSDTTYRIYDWGRVGRDGRPRPTHVEEALSCVRFGEPERPPSRPVWSTPAAGLRTATLAATQLFHMEALAVSGASRLDAEGSFSVYAVVEGSGRLSVEGDGREWSLSTGDVWLVPAVCGYHRVTPDGDEVRLVRALHRAVRT